MGAFLGLLFLVLFIIFFERIVDLLVGSDSSMNLIRIKAKVLFRTIGFPVLLGFLLPFLTLTGDKTINIPFSVGLLIGGFVKAFFAEGEYLTNLDVVNSRLEIAYITPWTGRRYSGLDLVDELQVEVVKSNWFVDAPAALCIKDSGKWNKFYFADKKTKSDILEKIDFLNKDESAASSNV